MCVRLLLPGTDCSCLCSFLAIPRLYWNPELQRSLSYNADYNFGLVLWKAFRKKVGKFNPWYLLYWSSWSHVISAYRELPEILYFIHFDAFFTYHMYISLFLVKFICSTLLSWLLKKYLRTFWSCCTWKCILKYHISNKYLLTDHVISRDWICKALPCFKKIFVGGNRHLQIWTYISRMWIFTL